jgi:hypothetical protein
LRLAIYLCKNAQATINKRKKHVTAKREKKETTEGNKPFKEFQMFPGDNEDCFLNVRS